MRIRYGDLKKLLESRDPHAMIMNLQNQYIKSSDDSILPVLEDAMIEEFGDDPFVMKEMIKTVLSSYHLVHILGEKNNQSLEFTLPDVKDDEIDYSSSDTLQMRTYAMQKVRSTINATMKSLGFEFIPVYGSVSEADYKKPGWKVKFVAATPDLSTSEGDPIKCSIFIEKA